MSAASEALRYSRESLLRSEIIYGYGFQSPGGANGLNKQLSAKMGLSKGMHVLDMGCGTGGTSFHIAKTYGCSVVGVDTQSNCIELCRERNTDTAHLTTFKQGSMSDSSLFPSDSFEAAWTRDAVLYLEGEQKDRTFSNFFSWLKPGGLLMVTDYGKGLLPGEKIDAYEKLTQVYMDTLETYKARLERAGFVVELAERLPEFGEQTRV